MRDLIINLCILGLFVAVQGLDYFRIFVVFVAFSLFVCGLIFLLAKLVKFAVAHSFDAKSENTERHEYDDPVGLGKAYVWNGKPAESEKGEKSAGDWLL